MDHGHMPPNDNTVRCSIIIPVYNASVDEIRRCIGSISGIKTAIEVILVDDGSTNGSIEKAGLAGMDGRVRILSKDNGGVSSARNRGIAIAAGEYITFCDIDDTIDADSFDRLFQDLGHNADVVCCSYTKWKNGRSTECRFENDFCLEKMLKEPNRYGTVWGKIYRTEAVRNTSFCEGLSHTEDTMFLTDLFLSGCSFATCDIPFYNYRSADGSASKKDIHAEEAFFDAFEMITQRTAGCSRSVKTSAKSFIVTNAIIYLRNFVFRGSDPVERQRESFRRLCDNRYVRDSVSGKRNKDSTTAVRVFSFVLAERLFELAKVIIFAYNVL